MPRVNESPELSVTLVRSRGQKLAPTMSACPAAAALGSVSVIVPLDEGCWLSVALWITVIGLPTIVGGGGGSGAETMAMLSFWLTFAFAESKTLIEAAKVPEAVGVPLILPALLIVRPLGSPLADHVYGETPPVAANVAEYPVPTVPAGSEVVEMDSGAGAGAEDAPLNATISMA